MPRKCTRAGSNSLGRQRDSASEDCGEGTEESGGRHEGRDQGHEGRDHGCDNAQSGPADGDSRSGDGGEPSRRLEGRRVGAGRGGTRGGAGASRCAQLVWAHTSHSLVSVFPLRVVYCYSECLYLFYNMCVCICNHTCIVLCLLWAHTPHSRSSTPFLSQRRPFRVSDSEHPLRVKLRAHS